ncbi:MAG: hypothetical protein M1814_004914 [Vezdaea aestivalis]|nr:MAG: hypothetical protein M1814_004914 [Vezdaea aestivalis]
MSHTWMPPTVVHHQDRVVSRQTAIEHIQKYLEEALTRPHMHPDATLSGIGAVLDHDTETRGVVLHNLERVEAGLRGEVLQAEDLEDFGQFEDDEECEEVNAKDWQNMEDYQRGQQTIASGGDQGHVAAVDDGEIPEVVVDDKSPNQTKPPSNGVHDASTTQLKKNSKRKAKDGEGKEKTPKKSKPVASGRQTIPTAEQSSQPQSSQIKSPMVDKAARKVAKAARQKGEKRSREEKKMKARTVEDT